MRCIRWALCALIAIAYGDSVLAQIDNPNTQGNFNCFDSGICNSTGSIKKISGLVLLESGSFVLLESGSKICLEGTVGC